jgi:hypothetical protein
LGFGELARIVDGDQLKPDLVVDIDGASVREPDAVAYRSAELVQELAGVRLAQPPSLGRNC